MNITITLSKDYGTDEICPDCGKIHSKDGKVPLEEALHILTDEWINNLEFCDMTLIDMRDALKKLLVRVKEYETFGVIEIMTRNVNIASFVKEKEDHIASLEQQLSDSIDVYNDTIDLKTQQQIKINELEQQISDERGVCETLRSQNSDAIKVVQTLERQLKDTLALNQKFTIELMQAEKREGK